MRNMLAFLAAMTLAFVCTGWYLNWFTFNSTPAPSGHRSVTVDFNTPKIAADLLEAEQKIQKNLTEKAQSATSTPQTPTPRPAPKATPGANFPVIDFSTGD